MPESTQISSLNLPFPPPILLPHALVGLLDEPVVGFDMVEDIWEQPTPLSYNLTLYRVGSAAVSDAGKTFRCFNHAASTWGH